MTVTNIHQKRHRLRKLRGETAYVDATPVRDHVATLLAAGWSLNSIAAVAGVAATSISKIHRGEQPSCRATLRAKVLAVDPDQLADRTTDASEPFVARTGTVRRIQALMYLGWTAAAMREHCGMNTHNLVNQEGRWVTRSTHDAVAAMYRELCTRPGPSVHAAGRAKKRGYVGPLAWHNIDRDATPYAGLDGELEDDYLDEPAIERRMAGDRSIRLTKAEAADLVRRWHAAGRSLNDCERVTGINPWRHIERQAS